MFVSVRKCARAHVFVRAQRSYLISNQLIYYPVTDYCKWDTFNAECAKPDEVVIMTSALYGRMERSNCIERDYGYVGCSGDVMTMADARCSGRRKCSIEIPDKTFDKSSICPKDLTRYFSATYMCQKGNDTAQVN